MNTQVLDHARGYGLISRLFHWSMAALLFWQMLSAISHYLLPDTAVESFFWRWHYDIGVLVFLLVFLRGGWGLANLSRRPSHQGTIHRLAALGHVALYGFMMAVPLIALIRAYGSERGFSALGVDILAPRSREIEWMTDLGNAWHGFAGWLFFALIVGHVVMALVHTYVWKEPMLARMTRGSEER